MGFFSKKDKDAGGDDPNRSALFGNRNSPAPSSAGGNPYAPPRSPAPSSNGGPPPSYRTGSYAPSVASTAADSNRDALFGGRQAAAAAQGGYGGGGQGGYGGVAPGAAAGGYGQDYDKADRQLNDSEEEEEDIDAVKQQIRFTKQESVSSTRNALRVAAQAEETGRNTLARLGAQGERLYNTEKNLDVAAAHNRRAEEKARELKTYNGSMFAIHMKNPMRSKQRAQEEEERILSRHQSEREEREQTRQFGYESKARVGGALKGNGYQPSVGRQGMSVAERSKYQFEADESDDEKEREIDANLTQLSSVTGRLNALALATRDEVDRQNAQIDKITKKSDRVDDQIALTHNRIKKIH